MTGRIERLWGVDAPIPFRFDGAALVGQAGDTVLTAILSQRPSLRSSDFGPERRAGFCLMGACQDCWIWQAGGRRLQACATQLEPGMELYSEAPKDWPA